MTKIFSFFTSIAVAIGSFLGLTKPVESPVEPPIVISQQVSRETVSREATDWNAEIQRMIREYVNASKDEPVFGAVNPFAGNTYNLSGGGVTSSATSLTLQSLTLKQTGQLIRTGDVASTTGIFYITLEPGNNNRQEIVSCTTVAQNTGGTATLSGCVRGLSPISPFTASTTLQFGHGGGTQVIFSDPPQFFNQYAAKENRETISGLWSYSSTTPPRYDQPPPNHSAGSVVATTSEFASVAYVNATGAGANVSASETVRGESELATRTEVASTTATGGTGAPLVIRASSATSTPGQNIIGGTGNNYVVVTRDDGTIHPNFIATSSADNYRFGGHQRFNFASTSFNGVDYRFPPEIPSNMASGTALVLNATTSPAGASFSFLPIATSSRGVLNQVVVTQGTNTLGANASTSFISTISTTTKTTTNSSYTRMKAIKVNMSGIYTTCFSLASLGDTQTILGRIYVDDVAVGTEQTATTADIYLTFCENVTVPIYSEIQLYARTSGAGTAGIRAFAVHFIPSIYPIRILD